MPGRPFSSRLTAQFGIPTVSDKMYIIQDRDPNFKYLPGSLHDQLPRKETVTKSESRLVIINFWY